MFELFYVEALGTKPTIWACYLDMQTKILKFEKKLNLLVSYRTGRPTKYKQIQILGHNKNSLGQL